MKKLLIICLTWLCIPIAVCHVSKVKRDITGTYKISQVNYDSIQFPQYLVILDCRHFICINKRKSIVLQKGEYRVKKKSIYFDINQELFIHNSDTLLNNDSRSLFLQYSDNNSIGLNINTVHINYVKTEDKVAFTELYNIETHNFRHQYLTLEGYNDSIALTNFGIKKPAEFLDKTKNLQISNPHSKKSQDLDVFFVKSNLYNDIHQFEFLGDLLGYNDTFCFFRIFRIFSNKEIDSLFILKLYWTNIISMKIADPTNSALNAVGTTLMSCSGLFGCCASPILSYNFKERKFNKKQFLNYEKYALGSFALGIPFVLKYREKYINIPGRAKQKKYWDLKN